MIKVFYFTNKVIKFLLEINIPIGNDMNNRNDEVKNIDNINNIVE